MATIDDRVKCVASFISKQVVNELHIAENVERREVFDSMSRSGRLNIILYQLLAIYDVCFEQNKKDFAVFQFKFLQECGQQFGVLCSQDRSNHDVLSVYNFIVYCVFSERQNSSVQSSENGDFSAAQSENKTPSSFKFKPETDRGLLAIGGGTLAQIWRVQKRRKDNENLSATQRESAAQLYQLTFKFRMTNEEKRSSELNASVTDRDWQGGLFIPKKNFLPFLNEANDSIRQHANEDAHKKYGGNILKVCVAEVKSLVHLWEMFREEAETLTPEAEETILHNFFDIWIRKLVHARLNEYIKGHYHKIADKSGKRGKGGQTLRDTLFTLTEKTVKKSKPDKAQVRFKTPVRKTDTLEQPTPVRDTKRVTGPPRKLNL